MNSRVALITFLDNQTGSIDNTLPTAPVYPSNALPGGGSINNDLPKPPGSIATLPVFPFDPSVPNNSLPGQGQGSTLPSLHPGMRLVVKFIACYGFIAVPDNELPETPEPK